MILFFLSYYGQSKGNEFAGRKEGTIKSSKIIFFLFLRSHYGNEFVGFLLPLFTSKYMEVEVKH